MADQTGYFTAYWSTFYNHSMEFIWGVDKKIEFSEGLLQTLCYETDIGSIPRGNTLDTSTSKPKYFDSNNWNCLIQGCYWCSDSKLDILGIFCSKECLFYFHDWCVERIYFFTKKRFCRFPGCDKSSNKKTLYCDDTHETEFRKVFSKWVDQHSLSKSILRDGPTWYKSEHPSNSCHKSGHSPNLSQQNSSVASPASQTQTSSATKNSPIIKNNAPKPPQNAKPSGKKKKDECPYMDFPSEFKNLLIFDTDIGVIPREKPTPIQLTSPYSSCPNWKRVTKGCYLCGCNSKTNTGNDYFNTFRCYLIFYEWCRRKINFYTGTDLCRLPGCVRTAYVGYDCCNKEHTLALQEIYGNVKKIDFEKMMERGPNWYEEKDSIKILSKESSIENKNSQYDATNQNSKKGNDQDSEKALPGTATKPVSDSKSSSATKNSPIIKINPPKPPQNAKPSGKKKKDECSYMDFPSEFKNLLIFETDIGVIPREKPTHFQLTSLYSGCPNWKRDTNGCYLCGCDSKTNMGNDYFNTFRCYLIFYEWCRRKINFFTGTDLCRLPGCVRTASVGYDCCNTEHTLALQEIYGNVKKIDFEKTMEQGPNWYEEKDSIKILSTTFCQLPGCPKYASDGFDCCNKEHYVIIQQKYTYCKNMDIKRLISTPPKWYNRSLTPFESIPPTNQHSQVKTSHQTFPNPGVNPTTALSSVVSGERPIGVVSSQSQTSPLNPPTNPATKLNRFRFSAKLSVFLSQYIDTKTIPRSHGEESSPSDHFPCRKEDIIGCYWCESNDTCFEEMACSARCWFLLHEWCVRRVEQVCALPGCEKPRVDACRCHCCSFEHIRDLSLMRGSVVFLSQEEMELTLGPKWYTDFTPVHFSASGPFSELSNSFPSLLILNHMIWPTVRHYMCAQKLLGTPYVHHMSKVERLTDLDEWGVCSDRWVRPDWEGVRKRVLYQALMTKFQQNCVLKGLLLRTRSRPLVCRDDTCLGDMLMSVREVVKAFRLFPNINLNSSGELSTEVPFGHLEQVNASHPFESFESPTNNPISDYLEDPHQPTDVSHDKEQLFS